MAGLPANFLQQIQRGANLSQRYKLNSLESDEHMRYLLIAVEKSMDEYASMKLKKETQLMLEEALSENQERFSPNISLIQDFATSINRSNLLHYLAYHNRAVELGKLVQFLSLDAVGELCKAGDRSKLTPLMLAVANGSLEALHVLTKVKCFMWFANVKGPKLYTALMLALLMDNLEAALILAKHDIDASVVGKGDFTALMLLFRLDLSNREEEAIRVMDEIMNTRSPLKLMISDIFFLIRSKQIPVLRHLIEKKPRLVNIADKKSGRTVLMDCCSATLNSAERCELVETVLNVHNIDISKRCKMGKTALDYFLDVCTDNETRESELIERLLHNDSEVSNVITLCLQRDKRRLATALLPLLGSDIPSTVYEAAFSSYSKSYMYTSKEYFPESLDILDTLVAKDPSCAYWTKEIILTDHLAGHGTEFTRLALMYALKHINQEEKQKQLKEFGCSLTSKASWNNRWGVFYINALIKYGVENFDDKISLGIYHVGGNVNNRRREEYKILNPGSQCVLCQNNRQSKVYQNDSEEACFVQNRHRGHIIHCQRCVFLRDNYITNGAYMKNMKKICQHNLSNFKTKSFEVHPDDLEVVCNAKLEADLLKKVTPKQLRLLGLE